jgi:RNA polymerase sigma factor (sigma-70 family)
MDGVAGVISQAETDGELLRRYARHRADDAFREIVHRHVDWVYSSALRQVRDRHVADDVTQAAFILLARKAKSFDERVVLSAWLFRAVRYIAADTIKAQHRRRHHERELGAVMNGTRRRDADRSASEADWDNIAPVLDGAIAGLGSSDQRAILLRFYERKSHAEVGAALGVSEAAAKVRVGRAIAKLRSVLTKHGVTVTAATLAVVLADSAVQAAPAHIAAAAAASASGAAITATTSTAANLTWLKGLVLAMTVGKTTTIVTCAVVALLAVGAIVYRSTSASPGDANVSADASRSSPAASASLRETYSLSPGQTVKYVKPPFGSSRADFILQAMKSMEGMLPPEFTSDKTALVLEWDDDRPGDELRFHVHGNYKPDLRFILAAVIGGHDTDFAGPQPLLERLVVGDWVFRKSSTPAERAKAMEPALREQLGIAVKIEHKRAPVEAIVITGSGLAPMTDAVQIYSDKLTDGKIDSRGQQNEFRAFVGLIRMATHMRVINESSVTDTTQIRSALHTSGLMGKMSPARTNAKLDLICKNLSRQTGLTFARATRQVETWVVTPEAQ